VPRETSASRSVSVSVGIYEEWKIFLCEIELVRSGWPNDASSAGRKPSNKASTSSLVGGAGARSINAPPRSAIPSTLGTLTNGASRAPPPMRACLGKAPTLLRRQQGRPRPISWRCGSVTAHRSNLPHYSSGAGRAMASVEGELMEDASELRGDDRAVRATIGTNRNAPEQSSEASQLGAKRAPI
jgi:hypothetical protein